MNMARDTETQVRELIRELFPGGIQPVSDEEALVALIAIIVHPRFQATCCTPHTGDQTARHPDNQHLFSEAEVAEWHRTLAAYRGQQRVGSSTMI
ncbi:MAG: hypothetical protein IPO88_29235 [Nannocystis sp.]|uniref:hypothetical protein n=1 Tax=Nannocystis sp. TaxID=1962667 RepID=UPI002429B9FF|nr:hypothetical protein [Nannocystis sp.]MBK9757515.1 hypothetical protein [Nannocystis sp.]